MSSMKQSNQTNFRVVIGCKVCKDAGKPESEYSTHFPKDREGKVICPTLLGLQCRFCHTPGHTISHCPTLAAKNKSQEKDKRRAEFANKNESNKAKAAAEINKPKTKYSFNILDSDAEEEEEIRPTTPTSPSILAEDFPALAHTSQQGAMSYGMSYASMAAKTIEEFENEQFEKKIRENSLKNIKINAPSTSKPAEKKALPLKASELDWAMEDSDSESDEDW